MKIMARNSLRRPSSCTSPPEERLKYATHNIEGNSWLQSLAGPPYCDDLPGCSAERIQSAELSKAASPIRRPLGDVKPGTAISDLAKIVCEDIKQANSS